MCRGSRLNIRPQQGGSSLQTLAPFESVSKNKKHRAVAPGRSE
jgi:hypothetical protein